MNEKVFYRFVEFTGKLCDYDISHETYKLIALDKYTVQTKEEMKVRRLTDAFHYLQKSVNQLFDQELLKTSYYLLTKNELSQDLMTSLINIYYQNKDLLAFKNATSLHLKILEADIDRKTEFGVLISSFVLIQHDYSPLIIYEADKEQYFQFSSESNEAELYNLFLMIEHQTRTTLASDNTSFSTTFDKVIEIIKENKKFLVDTFYVKHLYLYGSIVKDTTISTSDVDFLILFDDSLLVFEKNELISRCKEFLETKINAKVDLLEYNYSINHLELIEAQKSKQLF